MDVSISVLSITDSFAPSSLPPTERGHSLVNLGRSFDSAAAAVGWLADCVGCVAAALSFPVLPGPVRAEEEPLRHDSRRERQREGERDRVHYLQLLVTATATTFNFSPTLLSTSIHHLHLQHRIIPLTLAHTTQSTYLH